MLETMRKEYASQRYNLKAMMRKVMKQVVGDRDEQSVHFLLL
ncbi:hypothetical protein Hanom_Chr09g00825601 [Helianthus anomalus]